MFTQLTIHSFPFMKTPLVAPQSIEEDQELQKLIEFYNETLGFCPNSIKTMHIRPRIAYAFIEMNKAVMENKGRVTSALKRLIGYISSNVAGCKYCQAHTIVAADRYGAESQQIENIWEYKTHPSFSESEKAALDFALASSTIPNTVDDTIAVSLRKHWNNGEIIEILGVISLFGYLNRWNDSMGTPIEEGASKPAGRLISKEKWNKGKHAY